MLVRNLNRRTISTESGPRYSFSPLLETSRLHSSGLDNVQIKNSFQGKIRRRWIFLWRFIAAKANSDAVSRLEPICEKFFENDWIAGIRVRLRFLPGPEERELTIPWRGNKYLLRLRLLPWREQGSSAHWGAPITVTVSKKNQQGEPKIVRYMSLFIEGDVIHIIQLQGVPLIEMPKGLRDWAERFVKACIEFARRENFRAIRLARANSLYSYHNPTTRPYFTPKERERAMKQIRASMENHHDGTALALGFKPEIDWFRWENPNFCRQ